MALRDVARVELHHASACAGRGRAGAHILRRDWRRRPLVWDCPALTAGAGGCVIDPFSSLTAPGQVRERLSLRLVAHAALKPDISSFCIGVPGAMKCLMHEAIACDHASMRRGRSVPLSRRSCRPCRAARSGKQFAATRRPEIAASGIAAKHFRVTSSTSSEAKTRPQANWSWTKSRTSERLRPRSARIGARVPDARRRIRAPDAHRSAPSSSTETAR